MQYSPIYSITIPLYSMSMVMANGHNLPFSHNFLLDRLNWELPQLEFVLYVIISLLPGSRNNRSEIIWSIFFGGDF